MKLKDQVASLESSKRLKELDVKQESLFWWKFCTQKEPRSKWVDADKDGAWKPELLTYAPEEGQSKDAYLHTKWWRASAFTVAELGEMLPFRLRRTDDDYWLWQTKLKHGGTEIRYSDAFHQKIPFNQIQDDNEAEARAKMLIYLKENKLI